ncbi:hypothetical protein [Flavobacterium geliluteum]|uniref:Lipoprotein n=1 Tax=Flavobacterium geliluteum TaxID=2816120 RepID=A0A940XHW9_9FLAO|nr:hypothetical protein [Flavobacterium geliluteum]MBP4140120.1 hypothetical protein [Flavobacterium geliluteum]
MKKLILLGAFALLGSTIVSCTAEEMESQTKKEIKKTIQPVADGPGDDPIVPPPPKKD